MKDQDFVTSKIFYKQATLFENNCKSTNTEQKIHNDEERSELTKELKTNLGKRKKFKENYIDKIGLETKIGKESLIYKNYTFLFNIVTYPNYSKDEELKGNSHNIYISEDGKYMKSQIFNKNSSFYDITECIDKWDYLTNHGLIVGIEYYEYKPLIIGDIGRTTAGVNNSEKKISMELILITELDPSYIRFYKPQKDENKISYSFDEIENKKVFCEAIINLIKEITFEHSIRIKHLNIGLDIEYEKKGNKCRLGRSSIDQLVEIDHGKQSFYLNQLLELYRSDWDKYPDLEDTMKETILNELNNINNIKESLDDIMTKLKSENKKDNTAIINRVNNALINSNDLDHITEELENKILNYNLGNKSSIEYVYDNIIYCCSYLILAFQKILPAKNTISVVIKTMIFSFAIMTLMTTLPNYGDNTQYPDYFNESQPSRFLRHWEKEKVNFSPPNDDLIAFNVNSIRPAKVPPELVRDLIIPISYSNDVYYRDDIFSKNNLNLFSHYVPRVIKGPTINTNLHNTFSTFPPITERKTNLMDFAFFMKDYIEKNKDKIDNEDGEASKHLIAYYDQHLELFKAAIGRGYVLLK